MLSHSYSNALDVRNVLAHVYGNEECPHTFATFPPLLKCPCLGGTHSSIKVWPKILFPASTAAALFGRCLTLSP